MDKDNIWLDNAFPPKILGTKILKKAGEHIQIKSTWKKSQPLSISLVCCVKEPSTFRTLCIKKKKKKVSIFTAYSSNHWEVKEFKEFQSFPLVWSEGLQTTTTLEFSLNECNKGWQGNTVIRTQLHTKLPSVHSGDGKVGKNTSTLLGIWEYLTFFCHWTQSCIFITK